MAVKLRFRRPDTRVEAILSDPRSYFARARSDARAEIEAERRAEQHDEPRPVLRRRTA